MIIPTFAKKLFLPGGIIVCFAGMWFGLYRPEMRRINEYRTQPLATRQRIEQLTRQVSVYQTPSDAERAEWERLEREIKRKIPRDREITSLYASLSELAEKHALGELQRRLLDEAADTPQAREDGIPRRSFTLELTFAGGFSELIGFIRDVRSLDRLVEITMLDVTRGLPKVAVSMNLRCFYAPEG